MKTLTAVLAEDEANLREELRETLAALWPELMIVAEAEDGEDALAALDAHAPAVMFLDIQMPGMSGLDVARHASGRAHVVFVTAYDQYAIDAFEAGVLDYVLKPAERERLSRTVQRIRARLAAPPDIANVQHALARLAEKLQPAARLQWIQASIGAEIRMIPVDEVLYFVADEKYTRVQTAQQEALIRKPIKELLAELDPAQFWQIHRSTLINTNAIAGVTRDERGRQLVAIKGRPEKLEVSRSYAHLFKGM